MLPDKDSLIARANLLYQSMHGRDETQMLALYLPAMRECIEPSDQSLFDLWDQDTPVKLISWEILAAQRDHTYVGEPLEFCANQVFTASDGAIVITKQLDQEPGKQPNTGKMHHRWL